MKGKLSMLIFLICFSVLGVNSALADTLTLAGPDLIDHNQGWPKTGLEITALQNVTLQSFVFANYGGSDTIELTDKNNNVLYSTIYAGGSNQHQLITTNWAMTAGNTYHLISLDPSNSMYTYYNSSMSADAHIKVNGGFSETYDGSSYWFHFNNLTTTTSTVPVPAAAWLLAPGLVGLIGLKRKYLG
jgi:hypothetical protein